MKFSIIATLAAIALLSSGIHVTNNTGESHKVNELIASQVIKHFNDHD